MGLFGFGNKYPYTDFHELNLDWILGVIRSLQNEMQTFVNVNTIKYADPILWDISSQYEQNTLVQDADGITYLSKKAVPVGVNINNTDFWLKVADFSQLADIIKRSIASTDDGSATTSSDNRSKGELLWLNNYLYQVVRTINIGDAYVIGGINPNIVAVTVEQLINSVLSQGGIIKQSIAAADDADSATSTANRAVGELVWLNERLYEVIATITTGDAYVIGTNIQAVTIEQLFDDLRNEISTLIIPSLDSIRANIAAANDHDSATSTANRAIGELVWLNDTLYEVIATITTGDAYVIGTNIQAKTVESLLSDIQIDISNIQGDIIRIDNTIAGLADPAIANVKEYGAVGDGVTDDTAAVDAAIADINAGIKNVLYFPVGSYLVDSLTPITQGCVIHGQSRDHTIIIGKAGHSTAIFTLDGFTNGTICELTLTEQDVDNDDWFIRLYTGNFVNIRDLFIQVGLFLYNGDPTSPVVNGYFTQVDHVNGIALRGFILCNGARSVTYVTNCGVNSESTYTGSAISISPINTEYDTLVVDCCIFQRYYNTINFLAGAGLTISNIFISNTILDGTYARGITVDSAGIFYRLYCDNVYISQPNTNPYSALLLQTTGSGILADVNFRNCEFPFCFNSILVATGLKCIRFEGCTFPSFVNYGMIIDDSEYVQIINNKFGPNGSNSVGTYNCAIFVRRDNSVLITNNDFTGCTLGAAIGTGADACTNYVVDNNIILQVEHTEYHKVYLQVRCQVKVLIITQTDIHKLDGG